MAPIYLNVENKNVKKKKLLNLNDITHKNLTEHCKSEMNFFTKQNYFIFQFCLDNAKAPYKICNCKSPLALWTRAEVHRHVKYINLTFLPY